MKRIILLLVIALTATACVGVPFQGAYSIGHDADRHGWPAVDFRIPENTPMLAVADGTIVMAEPDPFAVGYLGIPHKFVVLRLDVPENGVKRVAYKHLNGYRVSVGQHVVRGQVIGRSGNDIVTNPHLHFDGQPDDNSLFNTKDEALGYPIIESCYAGRWTIHGSDTFTRGDRGYFGKC